MNKLYIILAICLICIIVYFGYKKEGFTGDGLVFNIPPPWFIKPKYNKDEWFVKYSPDQLSHPEGLPYNRGDPKMLNYMSSAYRFWRM